MDACKARGQGGKKQGVGSIRMDPKSSKNLGRNSTTHSAVAAPDTLSISAQACPANRTPSHSPETLTNILDLCTRALVSYLLTSTWACAVTCVAGSCRSHHDMLTCRHNQMTQPDVFENLYTRLGQRDPAKGCLDPAVLTSPDGRDFAEVTLALPDGGGSKLVRLPAFWAHLVDPTTLWDTENSDPVAHDGVEVFSEGTWSGGLLWDASIVATELLLHSPDWLASVRGATCLELGSGLGLPGLACALLGASKAVVTDRPAVARLVEDAIQINGLVDVASAVSFEWDAQGAKELLDGIGGSFPDVIIAVSTRPPFAFVKLCPPAGRRMAPPLYVADSLCIPRAPT